MDVVILDRKIILNPEFGEQPKIIKKLLLLFFNFRTQHNVQCLASFVVFIFSFKIFLEIMNSTTISQVP